MSGQMEVSGQGVSGQMEVSGQGVYVWGWVGVWSEGGGRSLPRDGYCRGWYASYWNEFFFGLCSENSKSCSRIIHFQHVSSFLSLITGCSTRNVMAFGDRSKVAAPGAHPHGPKYHPFFLEKSYVGVPLAYLDKLIGLSLQLDRKGDRFKHY